MNYGGSSYTYTWTVKKRRGEGAQWLSIAMELADTVAGFGLRVLQICDNLPLHEIGDEGLFDLNRCCRELGLALQIGTRGLSSKHLALYLNIAELCGAGLVRTMCPDLEGNETDAVTAIGELREICPRYEQEGVLLAIENHDKNPSEELAFIARSVGSENVGLCLDTVNSFAALETPEQTIRNMLPLALNIHLKDFDVVRANEQMGFSIEGRPLGEGRLRDYLDILLNSRVKDAIVELWTPYQGSLGSTMALEADWAKKSFRFLTSFE